jgi:hypothetical protein
MPVKLITMRLADMRRVHPGQIEGRCAKCNHVVGIYPSGQRAMRENPGIVVVCQVCRSPADITALAPGAEHEPMESKDKGD